MEEEKTYQELQAVTEDTYCEISQKQTKKLRAQTGGPPRQEDGRKNYKKQMTFLAPFIITIIILLVIIIFLVVWRTSELSCERTNSEGTSGSPYENTTPAGKQSECCPENWKKFNHSCYYFSLMPHIWSDAQNKCKQNQSDLVMIKSGEEQVFIKNAIKNDIFHYWIGLSDADREGDWKWVDGEPCKCTGANRLYWEDQEPDNWTDPNTKNDEDCAVIIPSGGWRDVLCKDAQRWICEKPVSIC